MNTVAAEPEVNHEEMEPSGYGEEPEGSYVAPPFETHTSEQNQNGFRRDDEYSASRGRGENEVQTHSEPFGSNIKEDG